RPHPRPRRTEVATTSMGSHPPPRILKTEAELRDKIRGFLRHDLLYGTLSLPDAAFRIVRIPRVNDGNNWRFEFMNPLPDALNGDGPKTAVIAAVLWVRAALMSRDHSCGPSAALYHPPLRAPYHPPSEQPPRNSRK